MNYRHFPILFTIATILTTFAIPAKAIDQDGLRVQVHETVLDRMDGRNTYNKEIDRDMALKLKITNIGFDDLEAGKLTYTVLVQRWEFSERKSYQRYTGTADIPALLRSKSTELTIGEYHIGGHMHGTSRKHVEDLGGWKLEFTLGNKKKLPSPTNRPSNA